MPGASLKNLLILSNGLMIMIDENDALILQIGARQGRLAEIVEVNDETRVIGRSFNADVVLTDPYVAPEQLKIYRHENRWLIDVMDNTNPIFLNGQTVTDMTTEIQSGDLLIVGRTRISVYSRNHEVEATRKLLMSHWLYRSKLGLLLPLLVVIVACALDALIDYQAVAKEVEFKQFVSSALTNGFVIILWASIWSLVGHLLRHQLHYFTQLLFTAIMAIFLVLALPLGAYLEYPTSSPVLSVLFTWLVLLVFFGMLLKFNLSFATQLKNSGVAAFAVSAFLLLVMYFAYTPSKDDFSTYPEYSKVLKPPFAKYSKNRSVEQFYTEFDAQFDQLEKMIESEKEGDT